MIIDQPTIDLIRAVAELGVIPLVAVLWKLNNSISELRTLMYREFLTFKGHEAWHRAESNGWANALRNTSRQSESDY